MTRKIAVCSCGAPLISTFLFSGKEWYCLECGRSFGWFCAPRSEYATARRVARLEKVTAEFREIAPALLTGGVMLKTCPTCEELNEAHIRHATTDEKLASIAAIDALKRRVRRV